MALNTITLKWDLSNLIQSGLQAVLSVTPTAQIADTADHLLIPPVPQTVTFNGTGQLPGIVANDNVNISPSGTGYLISVTTVSGQVIIPQFQTQLLFSGGAVQWLDQLVIVPVVTTGFQFMPLPSGSPSANWVPLATGSGQSSAWGAIPLNSSAASVQPVSAAAAAGSAGIAADAGHVHADANPVPADFGWVAWTLDPRLAGVGFAPAAGNIALSAFWLRKAAAAFSNITIQVNTIGSGLTASECFAGIYSAAGTLLGTTADQSGNWTSVGPKTMALTSAFQNPAAGMYWVAVLANGTTPPTIRAGVGATTSSFINTGLSAAQFPIAIAGTGTTLPASFTPSSLTQSGAAPFAAVIT